MAEQHLFSTGRLFALLGPYSVTASKRNSDGSSTAEPGLTDGHDATPVTFTVGSPTSASEWAILDLGASHPVGAIELAAASGTHGVNAYMTDDPALTPGTAGTTSLGVSSAISASVPMTVTFAPAQPVTGRYVLVVGIGSPGNSVTFSGARVFASEVEFGAVQEAQIALKWTCKELYAAASVSDFPIDIGVGGASWTVSTRSAAIRADALQAVIASQLATVSSTATNRLPQAVSMPAMRATFQAQDTSGRIVQFRMNYCRANGAQLPFRLNDFVVQGLELTAFPDASGSLGTITFGA